MLKREAIDILAAHRAGCLSVATMQSVAPWHKAGQGTPDHIDAVACMGSASSLGLGLAIGTPHRKVMVLDGDGSLLMQLGSLVTIGSLAPTNLYHFVFANGLYESSGNQPIPGEGRFDWCALAAGAGYREVRCFSGADELRAALPGLLALEGPVLIELKIARDDAPPTWAGVAMGDMAVAMKRALAEPA
jgi:sulfopyruvate decarboxylase subunit beta